MNAKKHIANLIVGCLGLLTACNTGNPETAVEKNTPVTMSQEELIDRGRYLTTIGSCHDCHSPKVMTPEGPEPDPTRLLSGHPQHDVLPTIPDNASQWISFSMDLTAFVGPWGISYAANLTPDETGIGNWSYEQFETAIRKGKSKGLDHNRSLLPPMPWPMYKHMSDEDLRAVFAFLKSLPPVNNVVPAPVSPQNVSKLTSLKK